MSLVEVYDMSLVAYGSSDESDDDLPTSKQSTGTDSLTSISLPRKPKETVKITIPSLSEFKEDESGDLPNKKLKRSTGSGLFSILPPPKYSSDSPSGFTPHILTKKREPSKTALHNKISKTISSTTQFKPFTTSNLPVTAATSCEPKTSEEVTEHKEIVNDFFSLESSESVKSTFYLNQESVISSIGISTDQSSEQSVSSSSTPCIPVDNFDKLQNEALYTMEENIPAYDSGASSYALPDSQEDIEQALLADEGFRKLQGRKREFDNLNIIEVKADDQITDRKEWLMKSLTEENTHRPSRKKHDMPTQQQKRKHQITYLAFQAKERELDLKNQWSSNSRTRRETQAKYGF